MLISWVCLCWINVFPVFSVFSSVFWSLCSVFLSAGLAGSLHQKWGLDFCHLAWPLVQQGVSVLLTGWLTWPDPAQQISVSLGAGLAVEVREEVLDVCVCQFRLWTQDVGGFGGQVRFLLVLTCVACNWIADIHLRWSDTLLFIFKSAKTLCGGQKAMFKNCLSLSSEYVTDTKLGSSSLAESGFTYWATSGPPLETSS